MDKEPRASDGGAWTGKRRVGQDIVRPSEPGSPSKGGRVVVQTKVTSRSNRPVAL